MAEGSGKYGIPAGESLLRGKVFAETASAHPHASRAMLFALSWEAFLARKHIFIDPHDLLAGYPLHYDLTCALPMTARNGGDFDPLERGRFRMDTAREKAEVREELGCELTPGLSRDLDVFLDNADCQLYKHWHGGHVAPGYGALLQKGFGGLLEEERESPAAGTEAVRTFQIATRACISYIGRYAALAKEELAKAERLVQCGPDAQRQRSDLRRMVESCRRIASGAPRTFFDALQLTWFAHELMICENHPASVSFGRFDQYLFPFFQRDVESGELALDEARRLLRSFWGKCRATAKSYQNLTLGGCDAQGRSSVNQLTMLCLETTRNLRYDQPSVTFRCTPDMPRNAVREVLDTIETGTGFPALFWDPVCIRAREAAGIDASDSWDYALTGCVELSCPGREYSMTEAGRLNLAKVLELVLGDGRDPVSGRMVGLGCNRDLHELEARGDFEAFFQWYLEEVRHFARVGMRAICAIDTMVSRRYPLAYLSTLTQGCIETGRDVTAGGARYNGSGFNLCGLATAADSLAAIRALVFERRVVGFDEVRQALACNFRGFEGLRHAALSECPKFGNDDESVDGLARRILETFCDVVGSAPTPRKGTFRAGLYTVEDHSFMGENTGATPDGRLARTALSNSMGPVQGADAAGPTALLNSVGGFDYAKAGNGMVLDLKFTPAFLSKPAHEAALVSLLRVYFQRGGMEAQVSVVDRETLLAAQREPEKHRDLVVRVSGFSAYFTTLDRTTQDEIIARTEES